MITRRSFLWTAAAASVASVRDRPNIVYILADDLGWGDLRCYNPQSAIPTPHADKMASQGMRFTDMHSASAVCTPTRYSILTGRYCWRTSLKRGVLYGYSPNLIEKGRLTVPEMLRRQGYYTAGVGKWHLGLGDAAKTDYSKPLRPGPVDHGFDYYYGIPASLDMDPYVWFENDRAVEQPTSTTPGENSPRGVFWRGGAMAPSFEIPQVLPTIAAKSVSIIRDRAAKNQPYFLYVPLTGPHTPWVPLKEFQGKSQAGIYGDFAAQVDAVVGQILKAVDESGAAANTLVIFTSDNGADWKVEDKEKFAHRANAAWRGEKADAWDGGHRIPFIARWPAQVRAGSVSNQLGCLSDLMATAAAITGFTLPVDAGEDSYNLLPALRGQAKAPIRTAVVHHSVTGVFAIREGDWKLIPGELGSGGFTRPQHIAPQPGGPGGQLYNIKADPAENRNLWLERQDVVRRLTALLETYQKQGHSRRT